MRKRVLFVTLPYYTNLYVTSSKYDRLCPTLPYGVLSVASYIKNIADVEIFDCCLYEDYMDKLVRTMRHFRPHIVGINMMYDSCFLYMNEIARAIRDTAPESKIVLGGAATPYVYKEVLKRVPELDAVCFRDGELPMEDLILNNVFCEAWATSPYSEPVKRIVGNLDDVINVDFSLINIDDYQTDLVLENFSPYVNPEKTVQLYMMGSRGCNRRCLSGDTVVNTLYGDIKIKILAEEYDTIPVLTIDKKNNNVLYADAINICKISENEEMVRVRFDDRTYIDCTPDHLFRVFVNGNQFVSVRDKEIMAQNLVPGMSVRAVRFLGRKQKNTYLRVSCKRHSVKCVHRLIMEYKLGRELTNDEVVHHIDRDKSNNDIDNLALTDKRNHIRVHHHPEYSKRMKENNPIKFIKREELVARGKSTRGIKRSAESKIRYRNSKLGAKNPNYKKLPFDLEVELQNILRAKSLQSYCRRWGIRYWLLWSKFKEQYGMTITEYRDKFGIDQNHKVVSVTKLEKRQDTYCMEVPGYDWFYANNVLVHNCTFCTNSKNPDKKIRHASIDAIMRHIDYLVSTYNINVLSLYDEQILANKKWAKDLFRGLQQFNLTIKLPSGVSTLYMDEEMVDLMWAAGVDAVGLAVESGSKRVLELMDKKVRLDQLPDIMRYLRKYNFFIRIFLVMGIPGETDEERQMSIRLIEELKPDVISPNIASPILGSRLRDECIEKGYIKTAELGMYDRMVPFITTEEFSAEYIKSQSLYANWKLNFVQNYRMAVGDYETAMRYFEYVATRYPYEAFAWYFMNKAREKLGISQDWSQFRKCIAEEKAWVDRFKMFGIDVGDCNAW